MITSGDGEPNLEVLGEQEGGIAAAKWSPDGELLVLLGANLAAEDSLQLLTADYEPVSVQRAVTDSQGETLVSVGWGSRIESDNI